MIDKIKFYIGPMSKNIIDSIINYVNENNEYIGIIPSRRQIDYNGGYVGWNTNEFVNYIRSKTNNIIIERDHGGKNQGDFEDDGLLSFNNDLINNFDIIHIDPWKSTNNYIDGLNETINTIKLLYSKNPNIYYEVGTEESIKKFDVIDLNNFLNDLKNEIGDIFKNVKYAVIQSGTSLKGTKNMGEFDHHKLEKMVNICQKLGVLSKEHNGDYLKIEDIQKKFKIGLSAINIAPEFGVYETDIILKNINEKQKNKLFEICYKSKKWEKWVDDDFDPFKNKIELIRICGHYQFNTKEFKDLNLNLNNIIKENLYNKIKLLHD